MVERGCRWRRGDSTASGDVLALPEAALDARGSAVGDQAGAAYCVSRDLAAALPAGDDAGVADLTAGLGVERRAVEDDLDLVAGRGLALARAPSRRSRGSAPARVLAS